MLAGPVAVAKAITQFLRDYTATPVAVAAAKRFVRVRRELRNQSLDAKGYEYVVEALLRPEITKFIQQQGFVPAGEPIQRHIYSSHFHTAREAEREYERWWEEFKSNHTKADTIDAAESLRRADLFIALPRRKIVSLEFKYVHPGATVPRTVCAKQLQQYLTSHAASVLVVYAGTPTSKRLQSSCADVVARIEGRAARHAFVAGPIVGPPVTFP